MISYFKVALVPLFIYTDEDSLDSFKECYYREAVDEEDYVRDHVHEMCDLSKVPGLENYID